MPNTKYVYIDIRSVCIPLETAPGVVSVRINHFLTALFVELNKEQDCLFEFIVFGRDNEFDQGNYFSHLKREDIPIFSIAEHFNFLLRQALPPNRQPAFKSLSADRFIILTYRDIPFGVALLDDDQEGGLCLFEPALPAVKDTLLISADRFYLLAARESRCAVCEIYEGGELNQADVDRLWDRAAQEEVTSILLSSDIDDTLFLLLAGYFSSTTVLNEKLLHFFKSMHDRFHAIKPISYQLLTARDNSETKFHLLETYHQLLDSFSADLMRYIAIKNADFVHLYSKLFASNPRSDLLLAERVEPTLVAGPPSQSGFFARPSRNPYLTFSYLNRIKALTNERLPFIGVLPTICTADPLAKSDKLKRARKPGRLIAHFDDSPHVIPDVRTKNPDVCMVEIYRPGMLVFDFVEKVKNWLHPPAPVLAPVLSRSSSLGSFDLINAGSFHQVDFDDDFVVVAAAVVTSANDQVRCTDVEGDFVSVEECRSSAQPRI